MSGNCGIIRGVLIMVGVQMAKMKVKDDKRSAESAFKAIAKGEKSGKGVEAYWEVKPEDVDKETFDLSVKNPNRKAEERASAAECRERIKAAVAEIGEIIKGWKNGD